MAKSIFARTVEKLVKTMVITGKNQKNCGWHSKVWDNNLYFICKLLILNITTTEVKQQDLKVQQKYETSLKSTRKVKRFLTAD